MNFRRVVAFVATLTAAAAMAQGSPQTAAPAMASSTAMTTAAIKPVVNPLPGDAKLGQGKAAICGACHGTDGNSSNVLYPKLAGQNVQYIVRQLHSFKSGKRQNPIMLGFISNLSDKDMFDIGTYFMSKRSRPGVADDALVKAGGALYREGDASRNIPACMACHGPAGRGNPGAVYPQLAGQHAGYLQRTLTAWHDGTVWGTDDHSKIMPVIARRLTAKDIAAVSSYLQGLHRNTDTQSESAAP